MRFFPVLLALFLVAHLGRAFAAAPTAPAAAHKASAKPAVKSNDTDDDGASADEDDDDEADVKVQSGKPGQKTAKVSESEDDDEEASLADQGKALSANVTLASDYILRGLSQTDHNPALQGGFDWEHPTGFYLGVWGSNVHFQDLPESLELDGYGGYTYYFAERKSISLGALYYSYWSDGDRDAWMFPLKGQYKGFTLELDYAPRWTGQDIQSWYLQGGWQDKVVWDVKLGALVGYSFFVGGTEPEYADFVISASREFFGVEWQVSGVFVNSSVINNAEGGDRAVFSVTKSL